MKTESLFVPLAVGPGLTLALLTVMALPTAAYPLGAGDLEPLCFVEITGDSNTDYSSLDGQAVQYGAMNVESGGLVKVAGTCAGGSGGAVAVITQPLTLQGGYTVTGITELPWSAPQPGEVTVLDGLNATDVISITAAGVTVDGFTIQNGANDNIVANEGGFTVTGNSFYSGTTGVSMEIEEPVVKETYTLPDVAVIRNSFMSAGAGVYLSIYVDGNSDTVTINLGRMSILSNTLASCNTGVYVEGPYVTRVAGGQVSVGALTLSGNRINEGAYGIGSSGCFDRITSTLVTVGDVIVAGNTLRNQTDSAIDLDYYDADHWYGTSTGIFGQLVIRDNDIVCADCDGVYVNDVGYMESLYDASSASAGDILIEGNLVDVSGDADSDGVYVSYDTILDLYDTSSATLGETWITENVITATGDGIYIDYYEIGYDVYNDTATALGQVHVTDNVVRAGATGIYVDFEDTAHGVYNSAQVLFGDFEIAANWVQGGSEGVNLTYDSTDVNADVDGTATVQLPAYNLINNVLARNSDSGVYVNGNAPITVVHNTIVSPTVGGGVGIHVLTGTTIITNTIIASYTIGISNTGGLVGEDYTLFAGVDNETKGTVPGGTHSLDNAYAGFVDPANDDYALLETSDAVDSGVNAGVAVDISGQFRPIGTGYDIGAYEYRRSIYLPLAVRSY
jgi:hypothetical protein